MSINNNKNSDKVNVNSTDYSIFDANHFFGGSDSIRIVINIYILLSLILNGINYHVMFMVMKKTKIKYALATWLLLGVLFMNFIHTATYSYEWVIKNDTYINTTHIPSNKENYTVEVGALLTGNPQHMTVCYFQGFFLIFSSISQDFLINIFFYLIDTPKFNKFYVKLAILILGILTPFSLTLILQALDGIGLNDEFCYVKKFYFNYTENEYKYFDNFQRFVMTVYSIRILNCMVTIYFLYKIIKYVRSENKPIRYLIKAIFIPFIQVITITTGVIYRFTNLINPIASQNLSAIYLIINTSDGFLFPIGFAMQNNILSQLKMLITGEIDAKYKKKQNEEKQLEFMGGEDIDAP